jgi:hypothetical protein
MSRPTTKEELAEYCLQRLGKPVIDINVDPIQVMDRIDDALDKFYDYHFDGVEEKFLVVKLQDSDVTNGYVTLLPQVFSVVKIFPFMASSFLSGSDLFSAQYQFFLNDFYVAPGMASGNVQYFDSLRAYTEMIQEQLSPVKSFHFNRKTNRIYFSESMHNIKAKAPLLMFKVYVKLDQDAFPEIWNDWFIKAYSTALIKKQWGQNLTKFTNVTLPGGIQLNGDQIYQQAENEIGELENKLIHDLSGPLDFCVG